MHHMLHAMHVSSKSTANIIVPSHDSVTVRNAERLVHGSDLPVFAIDVSGWVILDL